MPPTTSQVGLGDAGSSPAVPGAVRGAADLPSSSAGPAPAAGTLDAESYARSLARRTVGQIAQSVGVNKAHAASIEALSEVLTRFIRYLGQSSAAYARHASRSHAQLSDVLLALEDVLPGAVERLVKYAKEYAEDEDPFAHALPKFPAPKKVKRVPTFQEKGEAPPQHVPDFYPAMPDAHALRATRAYRSSDAGADERKARSVAAKRQEDAERVAKAMASRKVAGLEVPEMEKLGATATLTTAPTQPLAHASVKPLSTTGAGTNAQKDETDDRDKRQKREDPNIKKQSVDRAEKILRGDDKDKDEKV
ncbi:hypothetical protein PPROV_000131300 [Pycnococcus provasolii]|uniref:Bromodomain associated domain-containing protein n=1 Tax=Pycnococcus provasolii TaxID=41880 RepID=A0A830HBU3_9CHLO|nr:hypothetical protein PPROV_000131300 [Pycnococcus provasolii]